MTLVGIFLFLDNDEEVTEHIQETIHLQRQTLEIAQSKEKLDLQLEKLSEFVDLIEDELKKEETSVIGSDFSALDIHVGVLVDTLVNLKYDILTGRLSLLQIFKLRPRKL